MNVAAFVVCVVAAPTVACMRMPVLVLTVAPPLIVKVPIAAPLLDPSAKKTSPLFAVIEPPFTVTVAAVLPDEERNTRTPLVAAVSDEVVRLITFPPSMIAP